MTWVSLFYFYFIIYIFFCIYNVLWLSQTIMLQFYNMSQMNENTENLTPTMPKTGSSIYGPESSDTKVAYYYYN